MQSRRLTFLFETVVANCCTLALVSAYALAQQAPTEASAQSAATIHAETRRVLVDTVVTDKKGNYIRDLKAENFKVWEDNKEQPIRSLSFEDDSASPEK